MYKLKNNAAFSLVEIAIVLIIMGLLVVASISGVALLKSAEVRSIVAQVESYKIAADNFTAQYGGLPGDLKNATQFWPSVTVDGNNDGKIDAISEYYSFWHQLILSNILSIQLSAPGDSNANIGVVGLNMPKSKYFAGGYSAVWDANSLGYVDSLNRNFAGNYFFIATNSNNSYLSGDVFNPDEAMSIDNKIDDGNPDSGKVLGSGSSCTSGIAPDIEYNLFVNTISCFMAVLYSAP